ncbi:hypothetical protein EOPP23_12245 [Endozoicomonas sp. OPT23]|uniref:inositol phosphate phosphatase SopB n=1 Tax=Endozoicomonas sp. OPT23 TaxID=2072845 RepID=UPI00129A338D|nr:inositol phosphate phosphatase SopB [Endozoicomonas sp. OPT23]MRI33758.1 hypothetical protein [Endozoicomonas sp. OPT23]
MAPLEQILNPLLSGQSEPKGITPPSGRWKGRSVSAKPLLHGEIKTSGTADGSQVSKGLKAKYGDYIASHFDGELKSKKLSQRDVHRLETKACSLLRGIKEQNKQIVNELMEAGLARETFQEVFRHDWNSLCHEEQQHYEEQLRLGFSEAVIDLDVETVEKIALNITSKHQFLYSSQASKTSDYLLKQLPDSATVLPGSLKLWAMGHYDPDATPGELLKEDPFKDEVALSERDVKLLSNADHFSRKSAQLLNSSPLEKLQFQTYEEQIDEAQKQARSLIRQLNYHASPGHHIPDELNRAIKSDLIHQLGQMVELITELELDFIEDPLGDKGWQTFKENEVISALKLMDEVYKQSREKISSEKLEKLSQLKTDYMEQLKAIRADTDYNFPPKSSQSKKLTNQHPPEVVTAKDYSKRIESQLAEVIGAKAVKKLKDVRGQHMSEINWKTVRNRFDVRIQGKVNHYESEQLPAAQMKLGEGDHDVFSEQYRGAGRASSQKKEAQHAVNLGQTSFCKIENGRKKVLFRGLRSGTLAAYGIKDKKLRSEANLNRARELVTAAAKQYLDDHPGHPMDQPIPLRMLSTSLLSPDKARHLTGFHDDELVMQREQVAALKEIERQLRSGKPLVLTDGAGKKNELKVNLKVANTSYGVNSISLSGLQKMAGAWGESEKINHEGLAVIMGSTTPFDAVGGWAGEYLEGNASDKEKQIVRSLVEQIRDLQTSKDYKKEGEDAYKMVIRLQLLAFKLGVNGHINCKSGKDRTGETDASIKRFAAEVDALGYVPDPRKPITHEDQYLTQAFTFNTGNLELQQMNINVPGYKTRVSKKRLGQFAFDQAHKPKFHV